MKTILTSWAAILVATSAFAAEENWQATLRSELNVARSNSIWFMALYNIGRAHYKVPTAAGKILESRRSDELLPFLSQLRADPKPGAADIIDQWTVIVREGLRGTPSWVPSSMSGAATNRLEVLYYTFHQKVRESTKP
jgi:hypothetical protein